MNVAQLVLCDQLERFSVAKAIKFTSNDPSSKMLESAFNAAISKLETIFRKDAQQQVEAYKQNAMADYKERWSLRDENQRISETNQILKDELINIFDKLMDLAHLAFLPVKSR